MISRQFAILSQQWRICTKNMERPRHTDVLQYTQDDTASQNMGFPSIKNPSAAHAGSLKLKLLHFILTLPLRLDKRYNNLSMIR